MLSLLLYHLEHHLFFSWIKFKFLCFYFQMKFESHLWTWNNVVVVVVAACGYVDRRLALTPESPTHWCRPEFLQGPRSIHHKEAAASDGRCR